MTTAPEWSTEAALRNILHEMGERCVVLDRQAIEALLDPGADSFKIMWLDPEGNTEALVSETAVTPASIAADALQPGATDDPAFSSYSFDVERLHNSDHDTFTFTRTLDGKFYLLSCDTGRLGRYWKAGPFDTLDEAAKAKADSTYYEGMRLGIVQGIMTHPITGDPI